MEIPTVENLRTAFAQSIIATMATQVATYMRLAAHPDAQFGDFLDAVERNAVIGDDAAHRLHRRLNMPKGSDSPIVQRSYWEQVLVERGIPITAPFGARPATAAMTAATAEAVVPAAATAASVTAAVSEAELKVS